MITKFSLLSACDVHKNKQHDESFNGSDQQGQREIEYPDVKRCAAAQVINVKNIKI